MWALNSFFVQPSKGLPMVLFAPIHSHSSSMEDLLDVINEGMLFEYL